MLLSKLSALNYTNIPYAEQTALKYENLQK